MAKLDVQELIDAGIHFGHPASRWNPKMAPYIFGKRNFIHIIDLKATIRGIIRAKKFLTRRVAEGEDVLFIGTKRQARAAIEQQAARCGMPHVSNRWLGGTLTNFRTVRSRLSRLEELDQLEASGALQTYSKKMIASIEREHRKIRRNLEGVRTMTRLPGALVIVDPVREKSAVREAKKLGIPVIALADTEANPDDIAVVIPGNDDAMRAIEIVLAHLAEAIIEGKANRAARAAKEGEGQVLVRGPTRPRARAARRPPSSAEPPAPEMPLPKPHPASPAANDPASPASHPRRTPGPAPEGPAPAAPDRAPS